MSLPNKTTFNSLGGELNDYSPVTDPTTDLSAESSNETRSDVAAMTRTAIRAWVSFTYDGTVGNSDFDAVYGNAQIYKPSVSPLNHGIYRVTFPETVVDARGNSHAINLSVGWVNVDVENNNGWFATANKTSVNEFVVYAYSMIDASLQDPNGKLTLFVI